MDCVDYGSHIKIKNVDQCLVNKLCGNTYTIVGSNTGREYRRAKERAQKKQARKLACLPIYLK